MPQLTSGQRHTKVCDLVLIFTRQSQITPPLAVHPLGRRLILVTRRVSEGQWESLLVWAGPSKRSAIAGTSNRSVVDSEISATQ